MKKIIISLVVLAVIGLAFYFIHDRIANRLNRDPRFAGGNGRIEATEINVAARIAGKVEKVFVQEGEMVSGGDVLVAMQTNVLVANLKQAEAKLEQAVAAEASAKAKIEVQEAKIKRDQAELAKAKVLDKKAQQDYNRYKTLLTQEATTAEKYEKAETELLSAKARILSCEASIKEDEANLGTAKADLLGAKANIAAAKAEIAAIKADIDDSILRAPLKGRIQYRIAEPGEVLSAGGRAINMVDLTDVYMTFFLPEEAAGKVHIGADVRIVLDAVPDAPLPAKVTYVADVAQFTPKTVETKVERQKLMFRVKAHINRQLLEKFIDVVKTGLPGMAWVKLDEQAEWPEELQMSEAVKQRIQKRWESHQKAKAQQSKVVNSVTADQTRERKLKDRTGSPEAAAEKLNDLKKPQVEQSVKAAEKAAADREKQVSATVEAVKKANGEGK